MIIVKIYVSVFTIYNSLHGISNSQRIFECQYSNYFLKTRVVYFVHILNVEKKIQIWIYHECEKR